MKALTAAFGTFLISLTLFASPKNLPLKPEVAQLVEKYLSVNNENRECQGPNPTPCVEFVCTKLGTFGCSNQNKILPVVQACSANYGTSCLETACLLVSPWGCESQDRILSVARACKRNVDGSCLNAVCSHLTKFECDEVQDITPILQACAAN